MMDSFKAFGMRVLWSLEGCLLYLIGKRRQMDIPRKEIGKVFLP